MNGELATSPSSLSASSVLRWWTMLLLLLLSSSWPLVLAAHWTTLRGVFAPALDCCFTLSPAIVVVCVGRGHRRSNDEVVVGGEEGMLLICYWGCSAKISNAHLFFLCFVFRDPDAVTRVVPVRPDDPIRPSLKNDVAPEMMWALHTNTATNLEPLACFWLLFLFLVVAKKINMLGSFPVSRGFLGNFCAEKVHARQPIRWLVQLPTSMTNALHHDPLLLHRDAPKFPCGNVICVLDTIFLKVQIIVCPCCLQRILHSADRVGINKNYNFLDHVRLACDTLSALVYSFVPLGISKI